MNIGKRLKAYREYHQLTQEYMGYDEGVLHEHDGNVFFVNESNWLIARLVNHMTGEIVQDDIILDSGSITDVLNSRDAFFDYIFGTENH